jgi:hypothetical protein
MTDHIVAPAARRGQGGDASAPTVTDYLTEDDIRDWLPPGAVRWLAARCDHVALDGRLCWAAEDIADAVAMMDLDDTEEAKHGQ